MPTKRPVQVAFGEIHPRNFGSGRVRLTGPLAEKLTKLRSIEQLQIRYVNDMLFNQHHLGEQLRQSIMMPEWKAVLMDIGQYEVYPDLVLEFLATLQINSYNSTSSKCMKFKVLKQEVYLSVDDLSNILGLDEELQEGEERLTGMDLQTVNDFWGAIRRPTCTVAFHPGRSTRAQIDSELHRIFLYILGHTVQAKANGINKLTIFNLFCLYSLINRARIHMGVVLMKLFESHQVSGAHDRLAGIYVGPYVTWLFRNLWGDEFDRKLEAKRYEACAELRPRVLVPNVVITAMAAQTRDRNRHPQEELQHDDDSDGEEHGEAEEDVEMAPVDKGPSEPVAETSGAGRRRARAQRVHTAGIRASGARDRTDRPEEFSYGSAIQQLQSGLSALQLDFASHQQHVNAELLYLRDYGVETRRMMLDQGEETHRMLRELLDRQDGYDYPPPSPPPY